jgi:hypothetical protein
MTSLPRQPKAYSNPNGWIREKVYRQRAHVQEAFCAAQPDFTGRPCRLELSQPLQYESLHARMVYAA